MNAESFVIGAGFFAVGTAAGFFSMLLLRISIHAGKFQLVSGLGVVTTLGGGGFLSYMTRPIHFGFYALGFFIGFCAYIGYLYIRTFHPSRKGPGDRISWRPPEERPPATRYILLGPDGKPIRKPSKKTRKRDPKSNERNA